MENNYLADRNKKSNVPCDAPFDSSNSIQQCPNFPFFGAPYADAGCFDGYLRDLDDCDDDGGVFEHQDNWPCPFCNTEAFIKRFAEYRGIKYKDARKLVKELKERKGYGEPKGSNADSNTKQI
jgi:hypothetical protein